MPADHFGGEGLNVVDVLTGTGFLKSKGEARRGIQEGGIYVNNRRVTDPAMNVTISDFIEGKFLVLRRGKKNYLLVKAIEQEHGQKKNRLFYNSLFFVCPCS